MLKFDRREWGVLTKCPVCGSPLHVDKNDPKDPLEVWGHCENSNCEVNLVEREFERGTLREAMIRKAEKSMIENELANDEYHAAVLADDLVDELIRVIRDWEEC